MRFTFLRISLKTLLFTCSFVCSSSVYYPSLIPPVHFVVDSESILFLTFYVQPLHPYQDLAGAMFLLSFHLHLFRFQLNASSEKLSWPLPCLTNPYSLILCSQYFDAISCFTISSIFFLVQRKLVGILIDLCHWPTDVRSCLCSTQIALLYWRSFIHFHSSLRYLYWKMWLYFFSQLMAKTGALFVPVPEMELWCHIIS